MSNGLQGLRGVLCRAYSAQGFPWPVSWACIAPARQAGRADSYPGYDEVPAYPIPMFFNTILRQIRVRSPHPPGRTEGCGGCEVNHRRVGREWTLIDSAAKKLVHRHFGFAYDEPPKKCAGMAMQAAMPPEQGRIRCDEVAAHTTRVLAPLERTDVGRYIRWTASTSRIRLRRGMPSRSAWRSISRSVRPSASRRSAFSTKWNR